MEQIAKVFVDVPTMQTNSPYSYLIPQEFLNQIQVGMRVIVSFGKGNRKVQGMVVGIDDDKSFDGKLKEIDSIMDLQPVLNTELLKLSGYLAESTFSFAITCIQTILPNALKVKYEKELVPATTINDADKAQIFGGQKRLLFESDQLTTQQLSRLLKLKKANQIKINYLVQDRAKAKTEIQIKRTPNVSFLREEFDSIRKGAVQQERLLNYLVSMGEKQVSQSDLIEAADVSSATIKSGEKKKWLTRSRVEVLRDPFKHEVTRTQPLKLQPDQQNAVDAISEKINHSEYSPFLLEGVTGSGKTEVYLQSMAQALSENKTALMLVPEISLTPQMVNRVKARFGHQVAVLHSGLSDGEKYDEWRRIERGDAKVVVGARSAVFAPLNNIGIIIMDEEHETSYKQDESPRYHARDVALWRGKYHGCPVVLGSATPSLETRARAEKGLVTRLLLPNRINHQSLPAVSVVDMKNEISQHKESNFSTELLDAIKLRIQRKEQIVLMLNRRGYSSFIMCRDCGFVLMCPNCDISLTLHMDTHSMKCHYCGHEEAIPKICPNCQSHKIRYYGTGTQKVETELKELLPDARVIRMDVDTTRRKGAHEKLLDEFGNHEGDILLGTQMIAKGLDFPNVTLVGVLNADTSLGIPDYHSSERTFQLLTQVSGRAGRAEKAGQVIIQTFNPDHYAIQLAKSQNYEQFFAYEMKIRHESNYPPYYYAVQITTNAATEAEAAKLMFKIAKQAREVLSDQAIVLGPTPQTIARIKKRYYYQLIIKYKKEPQLNELLTKVLKNSQKLGRNAAKVSINPNPVSFM